MDYLTSSTERRWLEALIARSGLAVVRDRLMGEGVSFDFAGTHSDEPEQWGYRATFSDGRRRTVFLHLSSPRCGLAMTSFRKSDDWRLESDADEITYLRFAADLA